MTEKIIIDDASSPAVERGVYVIGYGDLVDGYRHAYEAPRRRGGGTEVRYSRYATHPPDPRCPECNPPAREGDNRG